MIKFQVFEQPAPKFPYAFTCSAQVYDAIKEYGKADRELFLVITVDAKNKMLDCCPISAGTTDQAAVYPREIVKAAIAAGASSVILAHNHPSGDPDPSAQDKRVTQNIVAACTLLEIKVLDHIVIGRESYTSLADLGTMAEIEETVRDTFSSFELSFT